MLSSREARRKTVGDVVTVENLPPESARWKADYSWAGRARPSGYFSVALLSSPSLDDPGQHSPCFRIWSTIAIAQF